MCKLSDQFMHRMLLLTLAMFRLVHAQNALTDFGCVQEMNIVLSVVPCLIIVDYVDMIGFGCFKLYNEVVVQCSFSYLSLLLWYIAYD